jgi:hypothetical protein
MNLIIALLQDLNLLQNTANFPIATTGNLPKPMLGSHLLLLTATVHLLSCS